jgi:hypothetical protein
VTSGSRSSCAKASSSASRCATGSAIPKETAIVGARQDGGGEGPQHRAGQRRDDDVGRQRHRFAVDGNRWKKGFSLEDVVDPAREIGKRHRLEIRRELRAPRGVERGIDAQGRERLPTGGIGAQAGERTGAIERRRKRVEPVDERAPRRPHERFEDRHRLFAQRACCADERQTRHAGRIGDLRLAQCRFERFERGGARDADRRRLQPIEPGIGTGVTPRRREQRHDRRAGPRGRQPPARLVADDELVSFEQGADAAHQRAVLRDQRDRRVAASDVRQDLRCGRGGLVFEAVADVERGRHRGNFAEGRARVDIGVDLQRRHRGALEQRPRERIDAARDHHHPAGGLQREQAIGGARRRARGPLERERRQQILLAARTALRVDEIVRASPPRRAFFRRHGSRHCHERMRRRHQTRSALREAAWIAA